ncbi:hypothetical protein GH714_031770 [Hevea brasiliensis]|uniref:RPW8 domain-containing protein n=1 Tax=Hevea brasiliensis TaxID=3981 RepID=A0A6A6L1E2_HEVBR|nr:hypothetical protein GH714_031770 [Hevea brasiliensis]
MFLVDVAVEAVLGKLLTAVTEVKLKSEKYEEILQRVETRISLIKPSYQRIQELNNDIAGGNTEINKLWKQIQDGEQLVRKCSSEKKCCSCFSKPRNYMNDLIDLDNSLSRFFEIAMIETIIGVKKNQEHVKDIQKEVTDIQNQVKDIQNKVKAIENISDNVKEIEKKVKDIQNIGDQVKEIEGKVKEIEGKVKDTSEDVKDIKDKLKGIQIDVKEICDHISSLLRSPNKGTDKPQLPVSPYSKSPIEEENSISSSRPSILDPPEVRDNHKQRLRSDDNKKVEPMNQSRNVDTVVTLSHPLVPPDSLKVKDIYDEMKDTGKKLEPLNPIKKSDNMSTASISLSPHVPVEPQSVKDIDNAEVIMKEARKKPEPLNATKKKYTVSAPLPPNLPREPMKVKDIPKAQDHVKEKIPIEKDENVEN